MYTKPLSHHLNVLQSNFKAVRQHACAMKQHRISKSVFLLLSSQRKQKHECKASSVGVAHGMKHCMRESSSASPSYQLLQYRKPRCKFKTQQLRLRRHTVGAYLGRASHGAIPGHPPLFGWCFLSLDFRNLLLLAPCEGILIRLAMGPQVACCFLTPQTPRPVSALIMQGLFWRIQPTLYYGIRDECI